MRTPRILFLILLLTLGHNWTFGCECIPTTSEEYFRRAEVVFTGKVLKIITDTNFWSTFKFVDRYSNPNDIELAQIEITEVFKGLNPRLKHVSIPIDHSSCQYNFTEDALAKVKPKEDEIRKKYGSYIVHYKDDWVVQ
jgi:hypothetical protein